jgi:hypothetical protein
VLTPAKPEWTWPAKAAGGASVRVTLVWIDPPGPPNTSVKLNDPTKALVHDLDLVVLDPKGNRHFPWSLTLNRTGTGDAEVLSRDRPNTVDNVERVDIPKERVEAGDWSVTVRLGSFASGRDRQAFALVVTGLVPP